MYRPSRRSLEDVLPDDRLAEIGEILTVGVIRLVAQKSSSFSALQAPSGELQSTGDEATCPTARPGRWT